jgi:hypothetical protein
VWVPKCGATLLQCVCCSGRRWLRQTLQTAAAADASHLLDINVHQTKAMTRSHSLASLSKVRRRETLQLHSPEAPDVAQAMPAPHTLPCYVTRKSQMNSNDEVC